MTFPPSTITTDLEFIAPIISDVIHEVNEGFFVIAQISYEDPVDQAAFEPVIMTGNTALIRIVNDDSKCL